jgi:hypothetical protein
MKIKRRKKNLLSVLSFIIMLSLGSPVCAQQSQCAMKAGDVFTGTVIGRFGPLAGANIREFGDDDDYINIEVADSLGRFSMQINNPEHKFSVLSFPYEVLEITPTSSPMEIKLETVRRSESGKPGPAYDAGGKYIKADYNYVSRQPVIPKEYICGYAVQPINFAEQRSWYGVFLHKDDNGYMVVLHYCGGGCADTIRVDDKLADRLYGSLKLAVDRAPSEQYGGDEVDILHEGSNVYALIPGQVAVIWKTEIPDRVWNRLYHQFGKNLGYKPVESRWIGSIDFGDGRVYSYPTMNDDGYAMTSFVNRLRYRYDIETGQAVVEYNKGGMPTGNLVIESSITVERKVWPVSAIEAGALENCTEVSSVSIPESVTSIGELAFRFCELDSVKLSSVNPIACPVNAFDESVYENAVLIVPKGWKQKKAAKIGPAWGKFKNIKLTNSL